MARVVLLVLLGALLWQQANSQAPTSAEVEGKVLSARGDPVSGVSVYGTYWKDCCPPEKEITKTDEKGLFKLSKPGKAIYFRKHDYQPYTWLVQPGKNEIQVVLQDAKESNWQIPNCRGGKEQGKRVGGFHGPFLFLIPKGTKVTKGVDTDYFYCYVRHPQEKAWLHILSGVSVGGTDPSQEELTQSSSYSERWIMLDTGELVGIDTVGRLRDRRKWRNAGMWNTDWGAYDGVSDEGAAFFDRIIDSVCFAPRWPKK